MKKLLFCLFIVLLKPFILLFECFSTLLYQLYLRFGKSNKGLLHYMYFYGLKKRSYKALNKNQLVRAEALANELITVAGDFKDDWNYGNAIHHGNTVLALIALKNGDIHQAENYLLKSADTIGSPQLNSFGPNFKLANELLLLGHRDVVLNYLSQVSKFWEMGDAFLPVWFKEIEEGNHPQAMRNFHTNKSHL